MTEEKVEKSVNTSLDDFINKEKLPEQKVEVETEQKEETNSEKAEKPVQTEQKEMLDPDDIQLGAPSGVTDSGKYKFDEGDFEEVEINKKITRVSKKSYKISSVSYQPDVAKRNIIAGVRDINEAIAQKKVFKSEKAVWVKTRLIITYEGTDYKSSLPNIKWWIKGFLDNPRNPLPQDVPKPTIQIVDKESLNSKYTAVTSKLHYQFWEKFGEQLGADTPNKLGFDVFLNELVGKEVFLMDSEDEDQNGNTTHRLDIWKFV